MIRQDRDGLAVFPCRRRKTSTALADAARPKTPYSAMERLSSLDCFQSECHIEFESAPSRHTNDLRSPDHSYAPARTRQHGKDRVVRHVAPRAFRFFSRRTAPHPCSMYASSPMPSKRRRILFLPLGFPCTDTRTPSEYFLHVRFTCLPLTSMALAASPRDMFLGFLRST
ncbi:MAG: hypothetical protein OXU25_03120 [Thaumarchaeota archaeon]|nr:hypothetical protein [Nitrososphaerota archaeon]